MVLKGKRDRSRRARDIFWGKCSL